MKRLLVAPALVALLCGYQLVTSCSNPLDTTPNPTPVPSFNTTDTLRVIDTVMVSDTGGCPDTVIVRDSGSCPDTVIVRDTVVHVDTVVVSDSVVHPDTIRVLDTVTVVDTLFHTVVDTLTVTDTVVHIDTLFNSTIDTVRVTDTVMHVDTLFHTIVDTLRVTDTVVQVDTVFVPEHDSSGGCNKGCDQISSHQHSVVWMLKNSAGHYQLVFTGDADRTQPPQTLIVDINGTTYHWTVVDQHELTIDTNLIKDTKITITLDEPKAYGHAISVCLKYSLL